MADDGIDPRTGAVVPTMAEIATMRERRTEPVMRIPPGWTYLGLYGTRSGRAKPHYRTAPAIARTRITPNMIEAYARCVAQEYGIDGDEAADAAMYIAYGRRPVGRFDRSRVPETPDFTVDMGAE